MYFPVFIVLGALSAAAHNTHLDYNAQDFRVISTPQKDSTWLEKYGAQIDQPFSGPLSFSHLPYSRCLENPDEAFDIAILGMPFDTGVGALTNEHCLSEQIQ